MKLFTHATLLALFGASVLAGLPQSVQAKGDPDKDAPLAPLGKAPTPEDSPYDPAKVELGRKLFYDPKIGGDASTPCIACHNPEQGWAFSDDLSRGYPGTVHWRNSQTIINSAYLKKMFWAGSAGSGEKQAKSAAKGGVAGNGENDIIMARLALTPEYVTSFREIYGSFVPRVGDVWDAIAAYERTMNQTGKYKSQLDKYLLGDKKALSASAKRGMNLFNGKANCIECHNGPMATDEKYYNIGVPYNTRWDEDGLAQITVRYELYAKGSNEKMYRSTKADPGFYFRTKNVWDKGKFRTPPLRYVKYTPPYMHNGTLWTLDEVIDFYNAGGGENDFPTKTPILKPLNLTDNEKADLVTFLEEGISGPEIPANRPTIPPVRSLAEIQKQFGAVETATK